MTAVDLRLLATEAEFQRAIESYLDAHRWHFYHDRAAMEVTCRHCGKRTPVPARNRAGLPDVIATNSRVLLMVELKRVGGKIRPEQQQWADRLATVDTLVSGICDPRATDALWDLISSGYVSVNDSLSDSLSVREIENGMPGSAVNAPGRQRNGGSHAQPV